MGTKMQLRILLSSALDRCPLPVVSSTRMTSPAPILRLSPSLAVICTPASRLMMCRVPVEVVSRRHLAEDDPGRRQALRKLSPACLLGPFYLDVPEVRLAARIGVEVVYPHRRVSREVGFEAAF